MGISLKSVVNGVKDVTSATLGTGQPNWSYIPSAAKQTKTQAEFITEIKELARNAATATNKADKDSIDRQLLQRELQNESRQHNRQQSSAKRQRPTGRESCRALALFSIALWSSRLRSCGACSHCLCHN